MRSLLVIIMLTLIAVSLSNCGSPDDNRSFAPGAGGTTNQPAPATEDQTGGDSDVDPAPESTPAATPPPANASTARISSFLWKPESERNNQLVVLVNATNIRIVVTGSISETLRNSGPSNGFGTTGRGSFEGCAYGNDVTVEFFDSRGRRVLTAGGRTSLSIPRGCDRFEFG